VRGHCLNGGSLEEFQMSIHLWKKKGQGKGREGGEIRVIEE
jgi:hypothetical protein